MCQCFMLLFTLKEKRISSRHVITKYIQTITWVISFGGQGKKSHLEFTRYFLTKLQALWLIINFLQLNYSFDGLVTQINARSLVGDGCYC